MSRRRRERPNLIFGIPIAALQKQVFGSRPRLLPQTLPRVSQKVFQQTKKPSGAYMIPDVFYPPDIPIPLTHSTSMMVPGVTYQIKEGGRATLHTPINYPEPYQPPKPRKGKRLTNI